MAKPLRENKHCEIIVGIEKELEAVRVLGQNVVRNRKTKCVCVCVCVCVRERERERERGKMPELRKRTRNIL